jgi:hypothetical protein
VRLRSCYRWTRELNAFIANCPVKDWGILDRAEKAETSKDNYAEYIREAFGNSYRLSDENWQKLRNGKFYNPWHRRNEINPSKILMFHAMDDPYVPYEAVSVLRKVPGSS